MEIGTVKFDLVLSLAESDEGIEGQIGYNLDLFEPATIERMLAHFQTLLEGMVENVEQRVADLPLLSEQEQQQLLVAWNQTQRDYPRDCCIHELFEARVQQTPDAIALLFEEAQLTYDELNRRATHLAYHLRPLGVGPEVCVGLCMDRSLDLIIGLLAILKAGGAYLPLDPAYPPERLALMLEETHAPVLLTQHALQSHLPSYQGAIVCLDPLSSSLSQDDVSTPVSGVSPANLAYVIYTSGSTGRPKGTLVTHQGLGNLVQAQIEAFDLHPASRVLQFASPSFDAAVSELFTTLLAGGTLVLAPRETLLPGPGVAGAHGRSGHNRRHFAAFGVSRFTRCLITHLADPGRGRRSVFCRSRRTMGYGTPLPQCLWANGSQCLCHHRPVY